MKQNYGTKLGLGYEDAKFNDLNNSQFFCFKIFVSLRFKFESGVDFKCLSSTRHVVFSRRPPLIKSLSDSRIAHSSSAFT